MPMAEKFTDENELPIVSYEHNNRPTIDGIIYPPKVTRELLEVFPKLPFKSGDVLINTYPKSGGTWVNEVLWQIYDNGEISQSTLKYMSKLEYLIYDRNKTIDEVINIVETNSCRIFKSHLQACFFPMQNNCPKYIIVTRNPKDTAVSYFNFYHLLKDLEYNGPWEEFFELFMRDEVMYGSWFDHVLGWWQRREDPNVLFLKYEDMKKDLAVSVKKLADFVGKDLSQKAIKKIVEQTTFKVMKTNEGQYDFWEHFRKDNVFFRKGQVGDWKNYFSEDQNRRMDEMIEEKLSGTGLQFEYE